MPTDLLKNSPEYELWIAVITTMLADARKRCSLYSVKCRKKTREAIIIKQIESYPMNEILFLIGISPIKLKNAVLRISNEGCSLHDIKEL